MIKTDDFLKIKGEIMNKKMYHINPIIGAPTICRADRIEDCPYSGETRSENHFNTYGEAQTAAQEFFTLTYELLSSDIDHNVGEIMEEIETRKKVKLETIEILAKKSEDEITKAIMETGDENVVMGVIEGEVYETSSWKYTSIALQNPNICKTFLHEALFDYPSEFTKETRRWLALNRSLTHEALVSLVENENEDIFVRSIALNNPNINKEYLLNILNNEVERLEKLPYQILLYNEQIKEISDEALTYKTSEPFLYDSLPEIISRTYKTWERRDK